MRNALLPVLVGILLIIVTVAFHFWVVWSVVTLILTGEANFWNITGTTLGVIYILAAFSPAGKN